MSAALQSAFARVRLSESDDPLARFVASADPEAFAAVVRRYGPVVYAVCRRVLGNAPDADDAFQATFLVLLRKANSVKAGSLGGWLFAVARRTAVYARTRRAARRTLPLDPDAMPAASPPPNSDVLAALDAELANLPAKYREPVVRCELDGQTIAEAAKALRVPVGTVASRLARGRAMLADRLRRRGFAATAVGVSAALAGSASARVPAKLLATTITGESVGPVSELATGTLQMMLVSKLKLAAKAGVAAALLATGVLAVGLGGSRPVQVAHAAPVPKDEEAKKKDLATAWADLASTDDLVASRALLRLRDVGTAGFFADKLKPLTLSEERAKKLLAELGGDKEETWRAAYEELGYLDPRLVMDVVSIVKEAKGDAHDQRLAALLYCRPPAEADCFHWCKITLRVNPAAPRPGTPVPASLQVTNHPNKPAEFRTILDKENVPQGISFAIATDAKALSSGYVQHPSWRRAVRATALLEHLATPEAAKVLEAMATGHADASPTKAAKEALERLKK